jgi:hypothetical protein
MSSGQLEVLLPCDVLTVDVQLGSKSQASPIQRIILETIEQKCGTIQDISNLLGIPHRPIMDLLLEFWRGGYVLLDLEHHHLQLSPEGSSLLHGADGSAVPEAEIVVSVDLLQERIAGNLIPYLRQPRSTNEMPSAPRLIDGHQYNRISSASVREVLNRTASVRTLRRNYKVLGFTFRRPPALHALKSENLPVTLRVGITAGGVLDIEALMQTGINASTAREIGEGLSRFVTSWPEHTFSQLLRKAARSAEDAEPRTFEASMREMQRLLTEMRNQGFTSIDPDRASVLSIAGARTADELELLESSQSDSDLIFGAEALWHSVESLLDHPFKQVVICLPEYDAGPYQRLAAMVKERLESGSARTHPSVGVKGFDKRVFLLWGRTSTDTPAFQHKQLLSEFEKISRSIHVASQTCSIESGFVLRDDKEGILFDRRCLRDRPGASMVAIRVAPRTKLDAGLTRGGLQSSAALAGLLDWVRRVHPDYDIGRLIKTSFDDTSDDVEQVLIPADFFGHGAFASAAETTQRTIFENWLLAWEDLVGCFEVRRQSLSAIATVLLGAQANDAILTMLEHGDPVILAVGAVDRRTFSNTFLHKLEERCKVGRMTTIVASFTRGVSPEVALSAVFGLANRFQSVLVLRERAAWTGLCAVHNETVVLGPGISWRTQLATNPQSHSLAIQVTDKLFARRIIEEIGKGLLDVDIASAEDIRPGIQMISPAPRITPKLFEWSVSYRLATNLDEQHSLIRDLCDLTRDLNRDLQSIELQLPDREFCEFLSRMTAQGLMGKGELSLWAPRIALQFWRDGRFAECCILGEAAGAANARPPLWLSQLALGIFDQDSVLHVLSDVENDIESPLCACALALCCHGVSRLRLPLEELLELVPNGPIKELAEVFRNYWDSCPHILPLYHKARAYSNAGTVTVDEALRRYSAIAAEAGDMMLNSKPCSMVMEKLFEDEGAIGALTKLLTRSPRELTPNAAADWIKRHGADAGRFLTSAESYVMIKGKRVKVVGERRNYLARYFKRLIDSIVGLANSTLESDRERGTILDNIKTLRKDVSRVRPEAERWMTNCPAGSFAPPLVRELLKALDVSGGPHVEPI